MSVARVVVRDHCFRLNSTDVIDVTQVQWERWLWTCILALLPLLLWLLLAQVVGVEWRTGAVETSRELMFFSLTICTVVLSELREVDIAQRYRYGYESFFIGSIVIIAVVAALYGLFLGVHAQRKYMAPLFALSMTAAAAGFILGTRAQIFIHSAGTNDGHRR